MAIASGTTAVVAHLDPSIWPVNVAGWVGLTLGVLGITFYLIRFGMWVAKGKKLRWRWDES